MGTALGDWSRGRILVSAALIVLAVGCAGASSPSQPSSDTASQPPASVPSQSSGSPSPSQSHPVPSEAPPSPSFTTGIAKDVLAKCPRKSATKAPVTFKEVAAEGQFSERLLRAPACTPIEITFTNYGAVIGMHHNIAITLGDGQWLFRGERVLTTVPVTYKIPPLPPGSYKFLSERRTSMNGILEVSAQP